MAKATVKFSRCLGVPSNSNSCLNVWPQSRRGCEPPAHGPLAKSHSILESLLRSHFGRKLTCSRLQDYSEGWSKSSRLAPISRHFLLTFLDWTTDTQCCSPKPHGSRLRANTFLDRTFPQQKQVFVIRYHWQGGSSFAVRQLISGRTPFAEEKTFGHVFVEYFLEHRSYQHRWNTAASTPKQLPSS